MKKLQKQVMGHLPQQVAPQLLGQMMGMRRELREQVKELQGQVKSQRELADYRGELLKEGELRFHALLQELSSSHRTLEALTRALPEPPQPAQEVPRKRWWWPFRRDAR